MTTDNSKPHVPETQPVITLTQGQFALIDTEDSDLGFKYRYHAVLKQSGFYAARNSTKGNRRTIYLHSEILERMIERPLLKGELCDHINGNTLDNRRANLRLATYSQNLRNQKRARHNTSGYKGVGWHKASGKWRAYIQFNGKHISLGYFDTPESAYEAYKKGALEYFGEFSRFE